MLLVVVMHAGLRIVPGDGGVTVFFVISGFVITSLLLAEQRRTGGFAAGGFYRRRLLKLGPPFVVVVLLPTLLYAAARGVDRVSLASQVAFTYNWRQVQAPVLSEQVLPGSDVVWSLAIEEQFYLGFALLWLVLAPLARSRAWLAVTAVVVAVASLATRLLLSVGQPGDPSTWDPARALHVVHGTDARLESIAVGVLLALAWERRGARRHARPSLLGGPWALVLAGALLVVASLVVRGSWIEPVFRPTLHEAVAVLLLWFGLVAAPGRVRTAYDAVAGWGPVQLVGLASYSIYLAHLVVIEAVEPWVGGLGLPARLVVNTALGVAAGVLVWRLVEVPVVTWRRRQAPRDPASAEDADDDVAPLPSAEGAASAVGSTNR